MINKILLSTILVAAILSIVGGMVVASKYISRLPNPTVTHIQADFTGTRTTLKKAICVEFDVTNAESPRGLYKKIDNGFNATDVESPDCLVVRRLSSFKGNITGFVNGTFFATGESVVDKRSGWGYTEGKITIFDSQGNLVYRGEFKGVEQLLPTILDTQIIPAPETWDIDGSVQLQGLKFHSNQRIFANFEATSTKTNSGSTVAGSLDGVLITRILPIPIPSEVENAS